ncbi:BgTH12-01912 [Blumeria graminis f. sp. triticale]|uniref:Bgt-51383 n=2 Tax=Blumeria graminis TaxID=34373 RepID=A0A9X9MFQ1_BLUGR|nr:BgTH12-01911 [Blumeria graminis f. sp. triticale]CAD6501662.1 BgTH12-01912 [Blumeria graminis f. sp. triticale]VDB84257.1 Bgt-51383 [Blumeria graminis f. sp. tritici]
MVGRRLKALSTKVSSGICECTHYMSSPNVQMSHRCIYLLE